MSTRSHATALTAHAPAEAGHETSALGQALLGRLASFLTGLRAAAEERRVRRHLAALPDALLRDIGISEDEIHRIRACDRFTPRAWAERMGGRQLYNL